MDRKEKVNFILEQMRLTIANNDYDRAQIICKKVSVRYFTDLKDDTVQKHKLKYYKIMIEIGMKDKKYLEVSKYFIQLYETPIVKEQPQQVRPSIKGLNP